MIKQMKCGADWEAYDPASTVMCSVCIEEYTGYVAPGYGTNGYAQTAYNGYGYNNNMYTNGYNMGYSRGDITGNYCFYITW